MRDDPIEHARRLRKEMTPQEVALWQQLRALRAAGWHFRKQSPEGPYTLDFVCRRQKLAVEIDGVHHSGAGQAQHDERRDAYLRSRGFRILRFWGSEVERDLEGVVETIRAALGVSENDAPPLQHPALKGGRRYRSLVRLGLRRRT